MVSRLRLLPRYLLNLGFIQGGWTFIQAELLRRERVRMNKFPQPIHLRQGSTDLLVFREVILFKSYELPLKNLSVIIDGGANIGLTSLCFADNYPQAKIWSVEPDVINFEVLKRNTGHLNQITHICSALWNKVSFLRINGTLGDEWAYFVEECKDGDEGSFKAITIGSIIEQFKIQRIDLLKLDIEGAEREVFSDDYDFWIKRTKHILIELHDWMKPDCSKIIFRTLSKYNFTTSIFNGMLLFTNRDLE
jgi:FkbM family methyltransferase